MCNMEIIDLTASEEKLFENVFLTLRPTIKNCWFAVLLPTHPKQALPKKFYCLSEDFFFLVIFSQILLIRSTFKSYKAVF